MLKYKMRTILGLLLLVFICSNLTAQSRRYVEFNADWFFCLDSLSAYRDSSIGDQDWRQVDLPHDWSIELPFDSLSSGSSNTGRR